jgi:hypothetical protein
MPRPPEACPNCGADVPAGARACPGCGSDEATGWSEDARTDGLDLPEETFDYEEFIEKEFGADKPLPHGIHWFWWIVAILVLGVFIWLLLR